MAIRAAARGRPRSSAAALLIPLAAQLAACGSNDGATLRIVTPGKAAIPFEASDDSAYPARLMRAATAEGLVAFDPQGRVVPALADRWIVLDDGQSYIFRLRDGTWKDGSPLTGASAQGALRVAIDRLRGTAFALDLAVIDDIRVMAGRVIQIRLRQPFPDLLQLLAQPELGLVHRATNAGPMQMRRVGDVAELTAIAPERLGLPAVADWDKRMRTLRLSTGDGAIALRRFARGEVDVMLDGRMQQYPLIASLGLARVVRLDPAIGLFGLIVMPAGADGFLASPENREALSMAIDRDALIAAFNVAGWAATTRVVPAAVEDAPEASPERWTGETIAARQARARGVVARWRAEAGQAKQGRAEVGRAEAGRASAPVPSGPIVRIALPEGPGADLLFVRLQADFAAIGVSASRVAPGDVGVRGKEDLMLLDQVARYPRPAWFLNRFHCGMRRVLCDQGADALMDAMRQTADAPTRRRFLAEAEASVTAANVFLPIAAPLRFSLVGGGVGEGGFATNAIGWHPLMPMALTPK